MQPLTTIIIQMSIHITTGDQMLIKVVEKMCFSFFTPQIVVIYGDNIFLLAEKVQSHVIERRMMNRWSRIVHINFFELAGINNCSIGLLTSEFKSTCMRQMWDAFQWRWVFFFHTQIGNFISDAWKEIWIKLTKKRNRK